MANLYSGNADFTVTGDLAGLLRDFMRQDSRDADGLLAKLSKYATDQRMPFVAWRQILNEMARLYDDPDIGIRIGQAIKPRHCGVLGYLVQTSATIEEVFRCFERFQSLLYGGGMAILGIEANEVRVFWQVDDNLTSRENEQVTILSAITLIQGMYGDQTLPLKRVAFRYEAAKALDDLAVRYGGHWCGNAGESGFALDVTSLRRPLVTADRNLHDILDHQALALMEDLQDSAFVSDTVVAIDKAMLQGTITAPIVADMLHMSERSFFRRLKIQAMSFQELLTERRKILSRKYLEEGRLTDAEIALMLGYSEQSAFSRAFKAWFGQSPRDYKKQLPPRA